MDILKIAAICILASILCKLFEKEGKEYSLYIKLAAAAGILAAAVIYISPAVDSINELFLKTRADSEYLSILFKSAGICYISQFAYDICKDSGENLLASQIELAGKAALIVIALPLIGRLTELVTSFSGY